MNKNQLLNKINKPKSAKNPKPSQTHTGAILHSSKLNIRAQYKPYESHVHSPSKREQSHPKLTYGLV